VEATRLAGGYFENSDAGADPPRFDYPWQPGLTPAPKIDAINAWIKAYAEQHGYIYVHYHSAMKDEHDGLAANVNRDGVHPTPAG